MVTSNVKEPGGLWLLSLARQDLLRAHTGGGGWPSVGPPGQLHRSGEAGRREFSYLLFISYHLDTEVVEGQGSLESTSAKVLPSSSSSCTSTFYICGGFFVCLFVF